MLWVLGVAPQTRIPLHTLDQKRCFWIPKMVVFEMHYAKKYAMGSGVAPQPCIPLHTMGQMRCFWIPKMVVFEMHPAKKICYGFWGGAANMHTFAHHGPEKVFPDT